jgi:hypothetical protein
MSTTQHPEWTKEHSLTAPSDRDRSANWRPEQGAPPLTEDEVNSAIEALNNQGFTSKFPRVDRTYADPPISLQQIGLISFTPAKGATPNENGVFGFAKLRGNYASELEASQQAENLIRNVDSYHQIYHTYVGRPFPITASSDYSAKTDEIDIRRETTSSVSGAIVDKKKKDQKDIEEIKQREEALLAESKQTEEDPYETYITLRVKRAQLSWTYLEHIKKLKEIKEIIVRTRLTQDEMDEAHPEFAEKYFDKYKAAREEVGLDLDKDKKETQDNFMKFLVSEEPLPGIDNDDLVLRES